MNEEKLNKQRITSSMLDVLVTFYNQEEYVDKAIRSILSQKCNFTFRIIIGDDGSSDNTIRKIHEWIDRYPDLISLVQMEREPNQKYIGGFRASRNRLKLLSYVNAPYFIFLDGDDYYTDDSKFQLQIDVLEDPQNSDCVACSHFIEELHEDGRIQVFPWQNIPEGKYSIQKYWSDIYFHTDTSVIRSSIIKSLPYELIDNHFNDNMITYLIMQQGPIYFIPKSMACYLQTGNGIWTSKNYAMNSMRNMFLYDLCNIINPSLKKQTNIRFLNAWKQLVKFRNQISTDVNPALLEEAKAKSFEYSMMWCNYNSLELYGKLKLYNRMILVITQGYAFKICRKLNLLKR